MLLLLKNLLNFLRSIASLVDKFCFFPIKAQGKQTRYWMLAGWGLNPGQTASIETAPGHLLGSDSNFSGGLFIKTT